MTSRDMEFWGPLLTTAGNLVFTGGTPRPQVLAPSMRPAATCSREFPTNSGITAVPSSFSVDGKQYIAVQSGWGCGCRAHAQRLLKDMLPEGSDLSCAAGRRDLGVRPCLTRVRDDAGST